jgi:hypothetical protein
LTLVSLLRETESAWEFELNGTHRSTQYRDGFYSVWKPVFDYKHVVERGLWFPRDARKFGAMKIGCNFEKRRIMSAYEYFLWRTRNMVSQLAQHVPDHQKKRIKKLIH